MIEWLEMPFSPRQLLKNALESQKDENAFTEKQAMKNYHNHLKRFIKKYEKKEGSSQLAK